MPASEVISGQKKKRLKIGIITRDLQLWFGGFPDPFIITAGKKAALLTNRASFNQQHDEPHGNFAYSECYVPENSRFCLFTALLRC